ncbi:MAG: 3-deoxy-8-phosphooctulonate synthase [Calditrichaceae bacterium]|nr:3-deoxy-8-phosphooctulonate synthase [Calditrichia bacterium]NUQ39982.1 3-deoxy-8-phosphooctulonate synthase [Calditrichaceae bacterium]
MKQVQITERLTVGAGQPLTLIAGPCVVENEKMILHTAESIAKTVRDLPVQFIFKASYKKANRSSLKGFTGIDFAQALGILEKVRREFNLPVLTDIHNELEAPVVAEVAEVLQIPAFLCRQTDLLLAAGRTGRAVNIKKGQFLAPEDMQNAAEKVAGTGNTRILLTERGTTFGYRNLVVDMRGLVIMARSGYPVVYDATHSVQIPGGEGSASGGQPEFILPLARAALATGAASALFMEVHPDPPNALSDARSQLALEKFPEAIRQLVEVYGVMQKMER